MNEVGEISEEAIGAAAFSRAAGVGFVEACHRYVADRRLPDDELPVFYCRLSEALLHRGCRDDAVACARVAFELRPEQESVANVCAWVFSNCGRPQEAAAAYVRLLEIRPQWAEGHRHASGSFAAAGQIEPAMFHARAASDIDPNSFEFASHTACLLEAAGKYEEALAFCARAAAIEPANASVLRQMSGIEFALGRQDDAVALALQAL